MILLSYPTAPESSATFYTGQQAIQTILLIVAVICIPWMLLGKPVYRIIMNKRRANVCRKFYFEKILFLRQ
jgi:V-type H+-transporting ATPase subunit a